MEDVVPGALQRLREADIISMAGLTGASLGQEYCRIGAVHSTKRQGPRLTGIVDVPGHERFVRNMLAGIGGIDVVLLVVAADESIKPQTREHLAICELQGVQRGIVVLTKADLVDPEILELVRLELGDFLRGSFLENAPVIAVSSVTASGLDQLRAELIRLAKATLPRPADAPPFSLRA